MHILNLPISARREIARGTTEVVFEDSDNKFSFRAGQYLRLSIPDLIKEDPRGNYRDFSIASSPNEKGKIRIAVRHSESGFKQSLLGLPLNTQIKITGPFGNLALPDDTKQHIVFVAGGIGITPFFSMINFSLEQKDGRQILLLFGNKSEEDAPYLKDLKALAQKNANFSLKNKFGLIDKKFITENVTDTKSVIWFIAGPPAMVITVKDILTDAGVAGEQIHVEEFIGYEAGQSKFGLATINAAKTMTISDEIFFDALMQALNKIARVSKTSIDGTITYVNDRFLTTTKYTRDDLIGQNHRILKSGHHPQSFYLDLWETISSGKVWRGEIKDRAKDGSCHWTDTFITPVFDRDGKIVAYFSTGLLITDRKEAEESLKKRVEEIMQEKAKNEAFLASIGEGLIVVDKEGKTIIVNAAAKKILGWKSEEIAGKMFGDVAKLEDVKGNIIPHDKWPVEMARVSGTTITTTTGYYYLRKDGAKVPVAITATPVLVAGKNIGAIEVFRDITKEKEIEKLRTDFLALASHQLRTPLSGIKWLIETMRREVIGKITEKQRIYLDEVYKVNERMIKLVFDMLSALRLEGAENPIKTVQISVQQLFDNLLTATEAAAKARGVALRKGSENHRTLVIDTDEESLSTILEVFISNAVNYSTPGKEVVFDVKEETTGVVFLVQDSGIGIPKEEQARIFERFYRGSNAKLMKPEGTGLGLYIAKMLANKIGAIILFESEEGKGTIFYLRIPRSK